jgi:ubiquinone/menaquinone biosynthesis C-methylase UbiE
MIENTENKITVDGVDYNVADLSDAAKQQIQNLQFVEAQLQQLNNEWAVADTARMGYSRALAQEAAKKDQD